MNFNNNENNIIDNSTSFKRVRNDQNIYGNRVPKKYKVNTIFFIIILILFFLILSFFITYNWMISAIDISDKEEIIFEIKEGDLSKEIGKTLSNAGLIRSETAFKIYLKFNGIDHYTEGKYLATKANSLKEIMKKIEKGEIYDDTVIFQILEGKNINDIVEKSNELLGIDKNEFLETLKDTEYIEELISEYWFLTDEIKEPNIRYSLEGYLFPDTYHFIKYTNQKIVIETMLNRTEEILEPYKSLYISITDGKTSVERELSVHKTLTLASCAELEGNNKENRREIISVFLNRIKKGEPLGSDPTTHYAFDIPLEQGLTNVQLNTEHIYNTRGPNMNGKYPPSPICSPSQESIDAAFNPKNTKSLFFVSDKNGKIYFMETYAEHEAKIKELKEMDLWFVID